MTRHPYRIYLLLLPVFFSTSCLGQNTPLISDSALNSSITIIAKGDTVKELADSILIVFQDKHTIYWFGSNGRGVYRYDGKTILHFTTRHGLCSNKIMEIQEGKPGEIFFTTDRGINKFDGQTFSTLIPVASNAPDKDWNLAPGDLWFKGAQDSGVVYRYDGKFFYRLKFPKTKPAEEFISTHPRAQYPNMVFSPYDVYSIYKDHKGNVWFGTGMLGVCCYDGKSFTWITEAELEYDDVAFGIRSTIEDKDGKFWFSNTVNRYEIIPGKNGMSYTKEKAFSKSNKFNKDDCTYFMSSLLDSTGALWLVTFGAGVWRYDAEKKLVQYPVKDGDKTITLFSIYKDNQGVLWLGTHVDGAYRFNGKTFEKFKP